MTAIPPNAYKPFGTGQRACIGRQFAIQEAVLVLGMLVQRFDFVDHLDYQLKTKTTLTVKPDELFIQVRPRPGFQLDRTEPVAAQAPSQPAAVPALHVDRHGTPLAVLYGSNLGTAEAIATRLAQEGTERGFAVTLGALDDHVDDLPRGGALLVVCSSYNGTPPDNAAAFCTAIPAADGVAYSVFGCGSTEWASTYQAVPTRIDDGLAARGGAASAPAAKATPPPTSTPPTATGTRGSGPTSRARSGCPTRWRPQPRQARASRSR
jgi:cytochrome P450/NADPH-cytochrome P450 reductase